MRRLNRALRISLDNTEPSISVFVEMDYIVYQNYCHGAVLSKVLWETV